MGEWVTEAGASHFI